MSSASEQAVEKLSKILDVAGKAEEIVPDQQKQLQQHIMNQCKTSHVIGHRQQRTGTELSLLVTL